MPLLTNPISSGGKVFVGVGEKIAALNSADGTVAWSRAAGGWVGCCPEGEGDVVLLPTTQGLQALSLSDGHALWTHAMDPNAFNPARGLAIENGVAYFAFDDHTVSALDLGTGKVLWTSAPFPWPVDQRHPPIADGGDVVVPLEGGLARVSSQGAVAWTRMYSFLKMRSAAPAYLLTRNAVFLAGSDGIFAASLDSGEVIWSDSGIGQVVDIEIRGGVLVVVTGDGKNVSYAL